MKRRRCNLEYEGPSLDWQYIHYLLPRSACQHCLDRRVIYLWLYPYWDRCYQFGMECSRIFLKVYKNSKLFNNLILIEASSEPLLTSIDLWKLIIIPFYFKLHQLFVDNSTTPDIITYGSTITATIFSQETNAGNVMALISLQPYFLKKHMQEMLWH